MRTKSMRAACVIATLACAIFPAKGWAVVAVRDYTFNIVNGSFQEVDPPYSGDFVVTVPGDSILSADILIPSFSLQFEQITSQGPNGGQYDVDLVDTTDTYDLDLVIDTPSDLFNDTNGATIDLTSTLILISGPVVVGGLFTGDLDVAVPAPPALPVFATGLAMLAAFAWRRKRTAD